MQFFGAEAAPHDGHEPCCQLIFGDGIRRCPGDQVGDFGIRQDFAVALLANQIDHMHGAGSPSAYGNSTWVASPCIGNHGCGWVRAITTCSYHKSVVYYSRALANSWRRSMLFSSGDYPRTLSSILSGEGLDEREQG